MNQDKLCIVCNGTLPSHHGHCSCNQPKTIDYELTNILCDLSSEQVHIALYDGSVTDSLDNAKAKIKSLIEAEKVKAYNDGKAYRDMQSDLSDFEKQQIERDAVKGFVNLLMRSKFREEYECNRSAEMFDVNLANYLNEYLTQKQDDKNN